MQNTFDKIKTRKEISMSEIYTVSIATEKSFTKLNNKINSLQRYALQKITEFTTKYFSVVPT
jgi:hypothetical protein